MEMELFLGARTALKDGSLIFESPKHISSEGYFAEKGDTFHIASKEYVFAIGTYRFERDLRYKEDFLYQTNGIWMKYNEDLDPENYSSEVYTFLNDCYYKVCIKRSDNHDMTDDDVIKLRDLIKVLPTLKLKRSSNNNMMEYFITESEELIKRYSMYKTDEKDILSFILVADTHNLINSAWCDSQKNIEYVARRINPDAIIHLGDLTDGILMRERTLLYANEVIEGLKIDNIPLFIVLGNHDANYYLKNRDVMSIEDQARTYLKSDKPYYYKDIKGVRMIFLHSYDNDNNTRYGFLDEEIIWLNELLMSTHHDTKIVIFSHDAPVSRLDYWADNIHNGEKLIDILENDNKENKNRVLAFIHGHTHADFICRDYSFPIVSVGCNKCEDFTKYKPPGSITQKREFNDVTQDLWDLMVLSKADNSIKLLRFGAGEDRSVR